MAVAAARSAPKSAPKTAPKTAKPAAKTTKPAQATKPAETAKVKADVKVAERQAAAATTVEATRKLNAGIEKAAADKVKAAEKVGAKDKVATPQAVKKGVAPTAYERAGQEARERTARLDQEFADARAKDPTVAKGLPPGGKPDFRTHASEFPKTDSMLGKNTASVHTKGPITVDRNSATLGVDGNSFHVNWRPLGPDGRMQTVASSADNKGTPGGGHFIGSSSQTFTPPYNNPHGWIADVSLDGRPPVNANSAGVFTTVRGS